MVLAYKTNKSHFALFDGEGKRYKNNGRLKWFAKRYWRVIGKMKQNLQNIINSIFEH